MKKWNFRESLAENLLDLDVFMSMSLARTLVQQTQKPDTINQVLDWVEEWLDYSESTNCLYDVLYSVASTKAQKEMALKLLKKQEKEQFLNLQKEEK